ncbi:polysaccharide deacetylase family protein [Parabacteroides faecis]|uniref:polysaccharide deacetylase family protein n=1 Tax=Parabacteroides faecis TaxID=1217282 RepID=UPI0021660475|nr:polysaccharide deacetylase family protein [Parabacteroides faecis]MCS2894172.1 polysaccharide deacetylase family protein [Parabacteroides faecis]
MNNHAIHYIIRFLLGEDISEEIVAAIGYTNNSKHFERYSIVIIPSGFFTNHTYGTTSSLPELPLQEIEGTPLLFGSPLVEQVGGTLVIHADIIASTYFLITRYEEIIQRNIRDEHGRFPGKMSLPYRAGFLHRPIVDEYRLLLRKWLQQYGLRLPEVKKEIQHIWLTHDLDAPTLYRTWKGVIRSIRDKRGLISSIQGRYGPVENDPYYTFPWIFEQNNLLREQTGKEICQAILFIRSGGKCKQDKPHYSLHSKDISQLIESVLFNDMKIGLHSSYQAGKSPSLIKKEKTILEENTGKSIRLNRHHFLSSREPEDMTHLEAAGITDDFTMGYADVAGFRLGTSYPVRWINPVTRRLSSILQHPLTIMDCSLEEKKYMGLSYEEAQAYSLNLIEQVKNVGGELTLLWHNTSAMENSGSYLRKLYSHLLNELAKK